MDEAPLPAPAELYQHAACGLAVAGAKGRLLRINDTLCRWLLYPESELADGTRRFQDLLTMGGKIFWQTHLHPLLRMQGSVAEVKLDLLRSDGKSLPMMLNFQERDWQGEPLLHISAFVAEDRNKYERELLLQRRRAEELAEQHARDQRDLAAAQAQAEDRALFAEQLVGMVSHDIRNPLSVIHMSTILLERTATTEQQRSIVARVARSVDRVQHLIRDLLDFTQARLGRGIGIRATTIDLHAVVRDAVAELALAFPERSIRHVPEPGSVRDVSCTGDPHRIAQAIGNLVANAVNHGAPDHPITVRTGLAEAGSTISVHNFGTPIPPEVIPRLFEPMVRGEGKVGGEGGIGLGLYIVREIVKGHGGRVDVRSSAEDGTTVTLVLPRAQV